jgi:hypothetical protein
MAQQDRYPRKSPYLAFERDSSLRESAMSDEMERRRIITLISTAQSHVNLIMNHRK